MRRFATRAALVALLACAPSTARPADERTAGGSDERTRAPAADSDHAAHEHRYVRITSTRLSPETLRLRANEVVAWINYSPQRIRIHFDRDVARRITCEDPSSFRLTEERLESADVRARQFASICRLEPGRYRYGVEFDPLASEDRVRWKDLEGTIIVAEE